MKRLGSVNNEDNLCKEKKLFNVKKLGFYLCKRFRGKEVVLYGASGVKGFT